MFTNRNASQKKVDNSKISRSHLLALGQNDSKPQNQHSVTVSSFIHNTKDWGKIKRYCEFLTYTTHLSRHKRSIPTLEFLCIVFKFYSSTSRGNHKVTAASVGIDLKRKTYGWFSSYASKDELKKI